MERIGQSHRETLQVAVMLIAGLCLQACSIEASIGEIESESIKLESEAIFNTTPMGKQAALTVESQYGVQSSISTFTDGIAAYTNDGYLVLTSTQGALLEKEDLIP